MRIWKAHAYGNDFLYVRTGDVPPPCDPPALARRVCDRHVGIGADGLILFEPTPAGARMRLINADGSHAEVSGNGVRGLAALVARDRALTSGQLEVATDAGVKALHLLESEAGRRFLFRADMGAATDIRRRRLDVAGEEIEAISLGMGNPQCVVLGPLDNGRLNRLGPALQIHPAFPEGVNVELAEVLAPDRVGILIWERGVGPTQSSGTGSCAAAVAAATAGGADRCVRVFAPGGDQLVEWTDEAVFLTGWAEVVLEGRWLA
jgi:diaminopimelate epimerase